ncbi:hypothetical protein MUK42_02189 [Musa troglodytarum]|uniref:IBH1-like N-terminal domain-containing protein n=1 Tax=Musa troglodytarum TaxID=320322 RepID=A0A9E7JHH7_9LILI|nr:hypothetical protein MUK42_02189 [Musa troglodytarum]
MQVTRAFKQAFLERMLLGFRATDVSSKSMSFQEKKSFIKLSADVAIAVARGSRKWTRGLIASVSKEQQKRLLPRVIPRKQYERLMKPCSSNSWKIPRSKKILRKSLRVSSTRRKKKLCAVEKRTRVLRRLVPGGESLSGFSLLDETLDYVLSLRAQVGLMQSLLMTCEASKRRAHELKCTSPETKASTVGNRGRCGGIP